MYSSETLTFKGKLTDSKNHKFNINVIANIELNDYRPEEIKIYSLEKNNYGLDLIDNYPFTNGILAIETETEKVRISLKTKEQKQNYIFGEISQLEIKRIEKVNNKKEIKKEIEVTYVLDEIGFTNNNLQWFWVEAVRKLNELTVISKEYEFEFKNLNIKCVYTPDVYTFLKNEKDAYVVKPSNTIKFFFDEFKEDEIIKITNNEIDILLRFISLFDNNECNYTKIGYSYTKEDKFLRYDFWNNVSKSNTSRKHYTVSEYFKVIDKMIGITNTKNDDLKHKIFVAMNRFSMASNQKDLSLKIALYHVTFVHLLSMLSEQTRPKVSNDTDVKKIFNEIGVSYDIYTIKQIVLFNNYRNIAFKGIDSNFEYDEQFFGVLETAIYHIGKLFTKLFELNPDEEKSFMDSIKINHIRQYTDYEEM